MTVTDYTYAADHLYNLRSLGLLTQREDKAILARIRKALVKATRAEVERKYGSYILK